MSRDGPVDVLIVGGGIAGLALAASLSGSGLSVTLLEGGEQPGSVPRGEALSEWDSRVSALTPVSVAMLEALGAWRHIPQSRTGPYQFMSVWDGQGTGSIRFSAAEQGAEWLGHIVENRETIAALLAQVTASSRCDVRWATRVSALNRTEEGLPSVSTDSGDRYSARLLVGADGARSPIRTLASMRVREWSYQQRAIVATVALENDHAGTCYQAFLPTGPLALLPLADRKKCSIVWSIDDSRWESLMALDEAEFCAALNAAIANRGPVVSGVGRRAAFPLRQCHAVDYVDDRVVLVADAAHSIHPLAGQGINLGLSDVRVLAQELAEAAINGLDWGDQTVLRRYQRQRKTENLAMMAAMEGFKRGFGSDVPLLRVLRNAGLSWVDGALPLKQWLAKQALGH
ncbi:protein VisC [Luminiphilus syltensis NOR5-1B]|uniref:Protein VisC n=1 Tax=Luminiphilus syltensis NOR5-1B TaxID=565045 RepID=B8KU47_9GAMM|nr:UbiH/UbiF/VisC/COQ6 family ubiquinone biosynthesis hydroxylase [Luminiphilus syltensis]EED34635.1 protein VisC [Luminiphilus syltensis NOR5-1B]